MLLSVDTAHLLICSHAVMDHLRRALKAGVLKSDLRTEEVGRLPSIVQARHPRWIIFLDRIASKAHFLRYAARYVRRPPIASLRLLKVTAREVDFLAKDTRAGVVVRTRCRLPDFVRLLEAQVPDLYRHAIRYFGCWHPERKVTTGRAFLLRWVKKCEKSVRA